jgi:hypothetical protein
MAAPSTSTINSRPADHSAAVPPASQQGEQLSLFSQLDIDEQLAEHRASWRYCWDWDGPTVGGFCQVNQCIAKLYEPIHDPKHRDVQFTIYAYMERCRLLKQLESGEWLAVIEMGIVHGKPWHKDGTLVVLDDLNIWPPVQDLIKEQEKYEQ